MKKQLAVGSMLLTILSGLGLHAQLTRRSDPFSGVWKLNTTKSTTSVPAPKGVRIKADKKGINFSEEVEDGETVTTTAEFNGKDYPVKGSSLADAASYERLGQRTIKSTVKQRGRTLLTETMTVSDDGKTLTVSFTQFPGIAVFDRE
jgi:hypothetical protein